MVFSFQIKAVISESNFSKSSNRVRFFFVALKSINLFLYVSLAVMANRSKIRYFIHYNNLAQLSFSDRHVLKHDSDGVILMQ